MTDKTDLIREIHEYVTTHGGENTATHLLVQAASAIQTQAAELEAVGAGGVQALSAAPAGWKLVPEDATEEMVRATDKVNFANADTDGTMHNVWNVMLAASPTPPAEQPHPDDTAVDRFAEALKAKLAAARAKGRGGWDTPECTQQRLSDMLREHVDKGDPRDVANFCLFLWARGEAIAPPAEQQATTTEPALEDVYAELPAPNLPRGGFPDLFTEGQMRNFADRTHALRMEQAATKAVPAWADQAVIEYRYTVGTHWCPLGPAERMKPDFQGVYRLQGGVFPVEQSAPKAAPGDRPISSASAKAAAHVAREFREAAPQQEAQEPVAWQGVHDQTDLYYTKPAQADVRPLYAAPQPAPAPLSDDVVKDAARYRWLIDQHWIQTEVDWRLISTDQDSTIKQLDAAIDAALAAQGGKA